VHDVKVMAKEIGFPIRKLPENNSLCPSYGSNQNRKTSAYQIENKHNVVIL
jgi:hypothetical protein